MENIIVAIYKVESEAYQAYAEMTARPSGDDGLVSQIAQVKKENGKISVVQFHDTGKTTADDTVYGGLMGALVGIIGGPIGMLLGASTGLLVGSTIDLGDQAQSVSLIEYAADKIEDGQNAMILLAQESDEKIIDGQLAKFAPAITRWDAAQVAAEVEAAQKAQAEIQRKLRKEMFKEKTDESKKKVEEFGDKIKADFQALKEKVTSKK